MRDGSTYRSTRKRRDRGVRQSQLLKWERKKRGISRRQLDRERGEKLNPQQGTQFTTGVTQ